LFAVELARALSESAGDAELPDTIEQIIASRFDRLDPSARRLIRVASVLGNQFHEAIVSAMLTEVDAEADIDAAFTSATAAGAITRRPGLRWAFNHALYRDTAYQGLPFNRRRQLHRMAAEIIEERAVDTAAIAPVLSLHYAEARAHEQAWRYSLQAADVAAAQNATAEAAIALERALKAGRYFRSVSQEERVRVAEQLADHNYTLARFDDANRLYRSARRANADAVSDINLMRKLGLVRERQGQPGAAITWFKRASRAVPANATGPRWISARAHLALAEAGLRSRRGENQACKRLALQAHDLAVEADDAAAQALALERAHLAVVFERENDSEGYGVRALEAHRQRGDYAGMARTLINLGIEAYFGSDWNEASTRYLEAAELAERSGSVVLAATATINGAEILSDQGHWSRAIELFEGAHRNYEAVGYRPGTAAARLFAGVAKMRAGQLDSADENFANVRATLEQLDMVEWIQDLDTRTLELMALRGEITPDAAESLVQAFGPGHAFEIRARRSLALAQLLGGSAGDAERELSALLELPACTGFERSLCLQALGRIDSTRGPEWRSEAKMIFLNLGVVQPPPLTASDLRGFPVGA
jgi:tetratricopeptide (TPR) repeat protein